MYNTIQTFQGAANAVGGAIRSARLDFLSDTVRDRRDDLEDAKKKADASLKIVKAARDAGFTDFNGLVETVEYQGKVDAEMQRYMLAQGRLDRAQNQQALWQAGTGAANFVQGMGYGTPMAYAAQQQVPVQVQVGAPVVAQPAYVPMIPGGLGGVGGVLVPAAAGFAGGAMAGALIDHRDRDRRRDP